jgi:PAS domain S-box-containing protein
MSGKSLLLRSGLNVADHVDAMLAYWDKDLVCRFANAAYLDWFGVHREDMIDKITLPELLGPLYEKNRPHITAALKGEHQVFEREIKTPSGQVRHSLATYAPDVVRGEVQGFFVHVADIGAVKKLEAELIKTNEIVNEQNQRLLNFANIVSHNLRSYANNFHLLIKMMDDAPDDDSRALFMEHLRSVSKSFTTTIANLDEIVHAQNQSALKAERISLREYVDKAIQILKANIEASHAAVINDVSASIILEVNSAYIESVLVNLLSNAIKYKDPHRSPTIRFRSFDLQDCYALAIEDNGIGIDLDRHGKDIFGMYKTFHGNADAKGIGLFITKYQVEAMRGQIEVRSKVGEGTMFTIRFRKG